MASLLQLHPSFSAIYTRQRRLFDTVLRFLFMTGGFLWIGWFFLKSDDPIDHLHFRLHQYQLYVLLLSLWGYQFRRDVRRLKLLIALASESHCNVEDVTYDAVCGHPDAKVFDVFDRRSPSSGWFAPIFTALFLLGSLSFIALQIHLIISAS